MSCAPAGRPGAGTRAGGPGSTRPRRGAPVVAGPVLSSTFHLAGPGDGKDYYGRAGNPTWRAYEDALASLEGGRPSCSDRAWPP